MIDILYHITVKLARSKNTIKLMLSSKIQSFDGPGPKVQKQSTVRKTILIPLKQIYKFSHKFT